VRKFLRATLVVVSAVALSTVMLAAGAGAGTVTPVGAAPLTILKTVSGPVPAGTTFTATVTCDSPIIVDGETGTDTATVGFDATGQPTTPDTLVFGDPGSCTVTETVNGGASTTTYSCTGVEPVEPVDPDPEVPSSAGFGAAAEPGDPICPTAGPHAAPIAVNVLFEDQTATVTIANTFDPVTTAPQAIALQPLFTG
jgi:hypothetical protein